jgi:hypothetical protein
VLEKVVYRITESIARVCHRAPKDLLLRFLFSKYKVGATAYIDPAKRAVVDDLVIRSVKK